MLTKEQLLIVLGVEGGWLTEAQAARLLGMDIVSARVLRLQAEEQASNLWQEYRQQHPPKLGGQGP